MTLEGRRWTPDGFGTASLVSNSATTRHPNEWPTKITGAPSAAVFGRRRPSWTFAPIWEGKLPAHLPLAIVVVLPKVAKACVSAGAVAAAGAGTHHKGRPHLVGAVGGLALLDEGVHCLFSACSCARFLRAARARACLAPCGSFWRSCGYRARVGCTIGAGAKS